MLTLWHTVHFWHVWIVLPSRAAVQSLTLIYTIVQLKLSYVALTDMCARFVAFSMK